MTHLVKFGGTPEEAVSCGVEMEVSPVSLVRVGNRYEGPCSIKTSVRDIFEFGAFSYINGRGRFSSVRVGRYCSIAEGVAIGYPEHPVDWLGTTSLQYMRPGWASVVGAWRVESHSPVKETIIGNDVWIGAGAYIKSGVAIGDGAIIGARAVVTRDVPPFSVMVGNPGKIIRHRLDEMLGREVQASQWWDFSPQQLDGCPFNRPKDALEFVGRLRANGELAYRGGYVKILPSGAAFNPNGA